MRKVALITVLVVCFAIGLSHQQNATQSFCPTYQCIGPGGYCTSNVTANPPIMKQCQVGYYCNTGSQSCVSLVAVGGSCQSSVACAGDSVCSSGFCTPKVYVYTAGGSCSGPNVCSTNFICLNSSCVTLPTQGQDCLSGRCNGGFYCDSTGKCQKPFTVAVGGNCTTNYACALGSFCSLTTLVCTKTVGDSNTDCSYNSSICGGNEVCGCPTQAQTTPKCYGPYNRIPTVSNSKAQSAQIALHTCATTNNCPTENNCTSCKGQICSLRNYNKEYDLNTQLPVLCYESPLDAYCANSASSLTVTLTVFALVALFLF